MGAVGSVGPAGVTLQFAIARRARGLCATVRELNLAHRRRRAPRLLGADFSQAAAVRGLRRGARPTLRLWLDEVIVEREVLSGKGRDRFQPDKEAEA